MLTRRTFISALTALPALAPLLKGSSGGMQIMSERKCPVCRHEIPPQFQMEWIDDIEDGHAHLSNGYRRIERGSPEWKERVMPVLKQQLAELRQTKDLTNA